jgi:nucleotide-binding universal stress UspA family protein
MYRAILVPLDGSPFGEHALPLALRAARLSNTALHLVRVYDTAQRPPDPLLRAIPPERAYLAGIADQLRTLWPGPIETILLAGAATEAIATYAESHGVDLVVMTTHGRGTLSRAWLGSVADQLVRQLPMPMLLVRPHATDPADSANPPRIDHILIPLDGSDWSASIIAPATALGRLTDARYTLVQTIEIITPAEAFGTYALSDRDIDAWIQESQQYLDRIASGLRAEGLHVQTEVVIGSPAITLLNYAHDHAVDLLALATHGRSGAARLFLGSVADKLVRGAGVPVLLQRPHPAPRPV